LWGAKNSRGNGFPRTGEPNLGYKYQQREPRGKTEEKKVLSYFQKFHTKKKGPRQPGIQLKIPMGRV